MAEDKFTLDTVDARCTDYNRTKMSLQLVLASLFPPRGHAVWEENNLEWQPIPFNYWPIREDHVNFCKTLSRTLSYKNNFRYWPILYKTVQSFVTCTGITSIRVKAKNYTKTIPTSSSTWSFTLETQWIASHWQIFISLWLRRFHSI